MCVCVIRSHEIMWKSWDGVAFGPTRLHIFFSDLLNDVESMLSYNKQIVSYTNKATHPSVKRAAVGGDVFCLWMNQSAHPHRRHT